MFLAQLVANSVIAGATYTLIALGFNLIYGATRFVHMTHGASAAIGAYAAFFAMRSLGWGILPALLFGTCAAGVAGVLFYALVFGPLKRKKASSVVLFISSLGIFTVVQALLAIAFSSEFWILLPPGTSRIWNVAGASITEVQFWIIGLAIVSAVGLFVFLRKTLLGKVIRALSNDEEVAKMLGINTHKVLYGVFFIGSALAGLAGVLIGMDTGIQPTMGLLIILEGAVPAILGGIGNLPGGIVGAFLLGFVENFGIWVIPSEWKGAIAFGLLTFFLLFRPQGMMGGK